MDLPGYIRVLRERWRLIAACVLAGLGTALVVTLLTPNVYSARAQLFVAASDMNSENAYQGGLFAQQRVRSYTQIITSQTVVDGVIRTVGLRTTADELARRISVDAPPDTVLIDITARDSSPQRAQALADATAAQSAKFITALESAPTRATPPVKVAVVDVAAPPLTPTSPQPVLNLAIGLFAGIVAGFAGAVLREVLDTSVRTSEDVGRDLGLTTLGVIPPADPRRGPPERAEAFRHLRTNLQFIDGGRMPRSVVVTSAASGEGKTATLVDLAVSHARAGQRVIIVEGDLRRPVLAESLGLADGAGLSSVLTGRAALGEALRDWGDGLLRVLPSGPIASDASELLASADMKQLLRTLEGEADLVLLDSPPLLPFTDGAVLAAEADAALLVVRAGRTGQEVLRGALASLVAVDARLLGVVLIRSPHKGTLAHRYPDGLAGTLRGQPRRRGRTADSGNGSPTSGRAAPRHSGARSAAPLD
ncbi:MAG: polysaccharide biosynthesis tyrosine autokinase [Haloechinothrix sp.]